MRYAVRALAHWAGEYKASVALAVVYIDEAHASDEWPISSARDAPRGEPVTIAAHRTLPDRLAAARALADDFALPAAGVAVLADAMDNAFRVAYAAWPIRWALLEAAPGGGAVTLAAIGEPEESSFDLSLVAEAIEAFRDRAAA